MPAQSPAVLDTTCWFQGSQTPSAINNKTAITREIGQTFTRAEILGHMDLFFIFIYLASGEKLFPPPGRGG